MTLPKDPFATIDGLDGVSRRSTLQALLGGLGLSALPESLARADEAAPIRVRFREGQLLRYAMTVQNVIALNDGEEIKQSVVDDTLFAWTVKEVSPDGKATIEQVYQRSRLRMKNPGVHAEIDTSKPASKKLPKPLQEMADILRIITGKTMTLTVNTRGEVETITFPQDFLDETGATQEFFRFGFERDRPLKRLGELGLIPLPSKPLAVGDIQEVDKSLHNPMTDAEINYRLKYKRCPDERAGGGNRIDFAIDFDPGALRALLARRYGVSGTIGVDAARGVIRDIDFKQMLAWDIRIGGKENQQFVSRKTRLLADGDDPFAEEAT